LYLTVHQVLFGPVYSWIEATAATERSAFFGRVGLYIVFAALLAAVSVVADYTRVMVVGSKARLGEAATSALRFIGRHTAPVVSLYLVTGALFVTLFVAYGLADRRLGGWRAV